MAGSGGISPGYVFLPSEQLLLDFYLRKKVDGQEADDHVLGAIPTVDLFGRDALPPWLLHPAAVARSSSKKSSSKKYSSKKYSSGSSSSFVPEKMIDWFYCFSRTCRRGPGSCRTTNCGTWLTSGGDKPVTTESDEDDDEGGEEGAVTILGYKCNLAFKIPASGGCGGGSKWVPTSWVMHEFKLHRAHPDVIRRQAAATCKKIYYKNNGGGRLFAEEEAAADQLVLCRIRCTKPCIMEPSPLKSGLGSPAGEEPPQKRHRAALMEVVSTSEGELGGQSSLAPVGSSDPSSDVASTEIAALDDDVDLIAMTTEGESRRQNPPPVVTPGLELIIERTELGEGCNHQNVPPVQQQQQQQVAVVPGAGLDSAAAPPLPHGGGIAAADEYSWMSEAAPDDVMWGMLISFLNE